MLLRTEPGMSVELEKLYDLLKSFSTAMLVTHNSAESEVRARPMAIAGVEESCVLWFITARESGKAHEIEHDTRVSVICQKEHSAYLSISGLAHLADDPEKIAEIWREPFKVWFPKGKDDPDILLIRVDPHLIEYWDNRGFKKIQYLLKAAGAYLTGSRPQVSEGTEHGVVKF